VNLAILRSAEFGVRIGDIGQPSGNGAAPLIGTPHSSTSECANDARKLA
jgi:hypothetical protein